MSAKSKDRRRREEAEREALLEPDAFVAQGATWSGWLEKNLKWVAGGLVLLLGLVVVLELVRSSGSGANAEATRALVPAVDAYEQAVSLQAVLTSTSAEKNAERYRAARDKLRAVLDGEGGPGVKAVARLYDADLARRLGKNEEAVAGFEFYLDSAPEADRLRFFALEGKGYALEAAGRADEALASFQAASEVSGFDDLGLAQVARLLESRGDASKARAAYERIRDREPTSPLAEFAKRRLEMLD